MDPHLLVGVVNTAIRNSCKDLEDLCKTHDIDQPSSLSVSRCAGYDYRPNNNSSR